jgi:hypothetical protein
LLCSTSFPIFSTLFCGVPSLGCKVDIYLHACNKTNLMDYLSSVYLVTIPLHVLGLLVAHRQEVTVYICDSWYVLYVFVLFHPSPLTVN